MSQKGQVQVLTVILVVGILALGGYLVYQNQTKSISTSQQAIQPSPNSLKSNIKLNIPDDWSIKISQTCNVAIPIPPQKPPYIIINDPNDSPIYNDEGRYWQFEEYQAGMLIFKTTARAIFRHPEEGSGYVPADIEVICAPNTKNDTTESLIARVELELPKGITIKSSKEGNIWDRKVMVVQLQGGMFQDEDYYIFATPTNIYLVRKIVGSQTKSVMDTADQILNNVHFID